MRAFITAMSFVLTLAMSTALAQSPTEVPSDKPERDPNNDRPRVQIEKMDIYVCPRHPEAKATWPARCPMCHARMQRRAPAPGPRRMDMERGAGPATRAASPQMRMRHRMIQMMMNTPIRVYDPETLLGSRRMLALSGQQVQELRQIAMKARRGAMSVLTDAQRRRLMPLERMTGAPLTMAQARRDMMQRTSSGRRIMAGAPMRGMERSNDPPAYEQGQDEYANDYSGSARDRLMDEDDEFDEDGGFGGDEGFDYDQGYDDEGGFGYDEGFDGEGGLGDDEGFGDEGFGFDQGFGNNEGFDNNERFRGDEGFRGNEGRRGDEGLRGDEALPGDEGLRGDEGFRGGEGFGGDEQAEPPSRER
jgi:hypothetical protein